MKIMKVAFSLFFLFNAYLGHSQKEFEEKFKETLESIDNFNNLDKLLKRSRNNNVLNFMELSYSMNANTLMYEKTKDKKYLEIGNSIIANVFNFKENTNKFNSSKWKFNSKAPKSQHLVGKEVFLFEGYLLRYIAEYLFFTKEVQGNTLLFKSTLENLENRFIYWSSKSQQKYKDNSDLLGVRVHMGAQKASLALYLFKMSDSEKNKEIYKSFYDQYNKALKQNLHLLNEKGYDYYVWNSTWDTSLCNQISDLKKEGKYNKEIQDVSHGNHVIQFIIDSYVFGEGNWKKEDLIRMSNTLKYKIWNGTNFADNIDGNNSNISSIKDTGWKQSDGWMKLTKYDKELIIIYNNFYQKNKGKIDKSMLNLQFYALFDIYQD